MQTPEKEKTANPPARASILSNKWFLSTVILLFALAFSLSANLSKSPAAPTGQVILSESDAKSQMQAFINKNLLQPGMSATIKNISEEGGIYRLAISVISGGQKQDVTSYATLDGKLFFVQGISVEDIGAEQKTPEQSNTQKSEKPVVDLFVMSFCPYGVQAENAMKPVADLLGAKADIRVRFIANVGGDTADSVQSLHGAPEAQEDLRQACVMKNYDSATYWKYVSEINANCYSIYRDPARLDSCWKYAAASAGVDAAKIGACSNSTEGVNLIKADEAKASEYGVRGSPTLIINGNVYSGERSTDAFKEAICSAFVTPPAECGTAVQAPVQNDTEQHSCG